MSLFGGLFGGGGGNTTTVQSADPWSGVQPYLKDAYGTLSDQSQNIPSYYPGQTYAGFTPEQTQSQQMQLNYANSPFLGMGINNGMNAFNYGLNSVYNPQSNPVINSYVNSATRPLYQAYNEQVMPGIKSNAEAAGGLGGSRQGVAEGLASRGLMNAVGDVSSGIYNNAYNQGLDQQARMAALAPQMLNLGMMPSQIYGQVGAQNQAMNQQGINESVNRYNFNQMAPWERNLSYLNALQGQGGGTTSTTGPDPNSSSTFANMVGGGLLGAGAVSAFGAPAATGFLGGWPIVAGGALLGGLFGG